MGNAADYLSQQLGVAGQRLSPGRAAVAQQLLSELPPGTAETTPLRQVVSDNLTLSALRCALRGRHGLPLPTLAAPSASSAAPSLRERLTGGQLLLPPHRSNHSPASTRWSKLLSTSPAVK
ncbi:MAG: hypothetical protein EOO63_08210 [Hymenobacter sp.]|nr:MAG: hypothetical protein EOO63_08210 [Hymenobacter sp.]